MAKIMKNGVEYSGGSSLVIVDEELNESSENPVQNKTVANALNDLQDLINEMELQYATSDDISVMFPVST